MSLDFSKCHCLKPGFCKLYGKVMEENPPNWQWCQNTTLEQRKIHYQQAKNRSGLSDPTEYVKPKYTIDFLPEQKSNLAICTIPANNDAKEQLRYTRESILSYASKCGADYIELSGDINPQWPMSNKYRLYDVSRKYEKTLYLDCDVFILNNAPNLFEITPDDKISAIDELPIFRNRNQLEWIKSQQEYVLTRILDSSEHAAGKLMINCGVMVIPKNLSEYYKQPKIDYPKFWCFDQHLLSLTLPKNKFNKLDMKWNLTHSSRKFFNSLESSYFIHINDCKPDDKMEMLKCLKENGLMSFQSKYRQKKILPVVMTYNKLFEKLAFFSSSSLNNKSIYIHLNEIDSEDSEDAGFNSKSWYESIINKIEFSKQVFDQLSYNECICVSDVDIFYINPNRVYDLKYYLQNSNLEFLAPSESGILKDKRSGYINAGFMIIKKTENTENIFDYILSHNLFDFRYADQDIINKFLNEKSINYEILDTDLFLMGCYMNDIGIQLDEVALLHTTCANSLEEKIIQINNMARRIGFKSIDFNNIKLTKNEVIKYKNGILINDNRDSSC